MFRYSRVAPVVALFAIATVVAACSSGESGDDEAGEKPKVERNGPAGPVPKGLGEFYGQSLRWESCKGYAESATAGTALNTPGMQCTKLTVPLDYSKPRGKTIKIGVSRQKAADPARRIGALMINPGGPGAAGVTAAAQTASQQKNTELGKRFDFVGFDPRGVGSSEPQVNCLTDAERDAERADDDEADTSPSGVAKQEADERDFARKCAKRTKHGEQMLANLGTRDVVKDMDVLRSALGDKKLNYLGYSYGTRIGSAYAETFPNNVRALVLDGALDPSQDKVDELVKQGAGFQKAFGKYVAWCVQRQDCALGRDPSKAVERFQDLVQPLIDRPVEVGDGRKLSFEDATTGAAQAMYSRDLWELLNTALNELRRNQGMRLMMLADAYNERGQNGSYTTTQDAFVAIRCVDEPRVTNKKELLDVQRRYKAAAPFLDDGAPPAGVREACAFWPVPNTRKPHIPNVEGLPPTLVVSTTNDPATPYQAGVKLAEALGGGLLTFDGTQHTAFLQGNKCVDKVGTDYLVNLKVPPKGTRCP